MSFNKSRNIKVNINSVELWLQNARHGISFKNESEAFNWFIEEHWSNTHKVMKQIVESNGLFNKLKVVRKNTKKYFIIDGNTRFAALQALKNPSLIDLKHKSQVKAVENILKANDITDLFKDNKIEVELFNEAEIDVVIQHEHYEGRQKANFDPYLQSKNQGKWQYCIVKDIDKSNRPPKYLLEKYLTKERANYIGIEFSSDGNLLSDITPKVEENIVKLMKLINSGPKGQFPLSDIEPNFYKTFPEKTKVVRTSEELNLATVNQNIVSGNKDNKNSKGQIKGINTSGKQRTTIFSKNCKIIISNKKAQKLRDLQEEMKKINSNSPLLASFAIRSFYEIAMKTLLNIDDDRKKNLDNFRTSCIDKLQQKQDFCEEYHKMIVRFLNSNIHSSYTKISWNIIIDCWDGIFPFINLIIDEINKANKD